MEKYPAALSYLRKNARLYNFPNENIIECDVLSGCPDLPKADLIISNPPYIKSEELPSLQKEVGFEPKTALDGGKDGLMFYRAICDRWLPCCKKAGRYFWNAVTRRARTSELFSTVRLHRRKLCTILIILTG